MQSRCEKPVEGKQVSVQTAKKHSIQCFQNFHFVCFESICSLNLWIHGIVVSFVTQITIWQKRNKHKEKTHVYMWVQYSESF